MGVYSVLVSDDRILKRIADAKSVVIIGCAACANDSIAYDKDYPLSKIIIDEKTGKEKQIPVPINAEANRLRELLESRGINTGIETWFGVCDVSYEREKQTSELVERCSNVDAVISLSCAGGTLALKKMFPKSIKIIPGMKTVGIFQICKILDKSGQFINMDRANSTNLRLFKYSDF